jgi:hypothetical protein
MCARAELWGRLCLPTPPPLKQDFLTIEESPVESLFFLTKGQVLMYFVRHRNHRVWSASGMHNACYCLCCFVFASLCASLQEGERLVQTYNPGGFRVGVRRACALIVMCERCLE